MRNSKPQLTVKEEDTSQFYVSLYFEALKKIDRVNDIKFSLLQLSLISTFAFFAWIIVYNTSLKNLDAWLKYTVWLIPFAFNTFGFFYNLYLKKTTKKTGKFIRYLVERIGNIEHVYDEFLKENQESPIHLSQWFWGTICLFSLLLGCSGASSFT